MTSDLIKEYCELENDSKALLRKAYDKYGYWLFSSIQTGVLVPSGQ
jgi:hypothetical protein